jgi:hypothetical protein
MIFWFPLLIDIGQLKSHFKKATLRKDEQLARQDVQELIMISNTN